MLRKSDMPHTKSDLDVNKERGQQKQNLDTEQEQHLLHQKQSSGINCDSPGRVVRSCKNKNEKDSDVLMQIPDSNPAIPAEESNPVPVSHVMGDFPKIPKDEERTTGKSEAVGTNASQSNERMLIKTCQSGKVLEKLQPRRNTDAVGCGSRPDQLTVSSAHSEKISVPEAEPRPHYSRPFSHALMSKEEKVTTTKRDQLTISSAHSEKNSVPEAEPRPHNPRPFSHALMSKEEKVTKTKRDQLTISSAHPEKNSVPEAEPRPHNPRPFSPLMSKEEKVTTTKRESIVQNSVQALSSSVGVPVPKKLKKVEKLQPRRNPEPIVQESKSDVGTTPSKTPDKGLDDGYNWRKYGQKLVKGNKFVRSYYRCTHLNCQAKKQVEKSHDGCISDINYLGNHHHQKPQHGPQATSTLQERSPETPIASTSKTNFEVICKQSGLDQHTAPNETSPQSTLARNADGLTGVVSCPRNNTRDADDCPGSKRQKRDTSSADEDLLNRSSSGSRHVVQTLSEVDLVNDGYRWRKYGQKLVKGNPNPRSYYRCSSIGCPAKKHIERASHNPKLVITAYEGKHHHELPRGDSNMMNPNGESSSKPEDNSPVSREMVVHVTAN